MTLPTFKSSTDSELFNQIFDDHLTEYMNCQDKVREYMYGKGNGNYSNLPGSCIEHVVSITQYLLRHTYQEFVNQSPEYRIDRITESLHQCHEEYPEWGNTHTDTEFTVLGDK